MNWDDRIHKISEQHGFEPGAVEFMAHAIRQGGGRSARWNHAQLGGLGEWTPGRTLVRPPDAAWEKRLDALCGDVLDLLRETGGLEKAGVTGAEAWWPKTLGPSPDSAGGQNAVRYAYFADARRLAVDRGDGKGVTVYDTGEHRIRGVSQRQSSTVPGDLIFQSQQGEVELSKLKAAPPAGA